MYHTIVYRKVIRRNVRNQIEGIVSLDGKDRFVVPWDRAKELLEKRFKYAHVLEDEKTLTVKIPHSILPEYTHVRAVLQNNDTVCYWGVNDNDGREARLTAPLAFLYVGVLHLPVEFVFSHPDNIDNIHETTRVDWVEDLSPSTFLNPND